MVLGWRGKDIVEAAAEMAPDTGRFGGRPQMRRFRAGVPSWSGRGRARLDWLDELVSELLARRHAASSQLQGEERSDPRSIRSMSRMPPKATFG